MRRKITEVIERWNSSNQKKALLIKGPRQVGKTFSIEEFGKRVYGEHFLEINFKDNPDAMDIFKGELDVDHIIMRMSAKFRDFDFVPYETLIFLDEIQNCPQARTALKPLAKDGRYKVIASGSLMGIRMRDVGLHPTGYLQRVDMHPMDFEEFLWALDMPQRVIEDVRGSISRMEPIDEFIYKTFSELFNTYLVVGGMPEALGSFVDSRMLNGLDEVFGELREGYSDDISSYAEGTAKALAGPCMQSIPRMLSMENKKFMYSKVESGGAVEGESDDPPIKEGSKNTGFRYFAPALNWLSMAGITLTCNNVSEPRAPLEERMQTDKFKLYLMDTGFLLSFYDKSVFQEVFGGNTDANLGAIAENAVAQAFSAQERELMYFSRDDPRAEVDFVTVVRGKVCCVEVKSGENRDCRSLNRVMRDYGTGGIMFETRNVFVDEKGVEHYPLFAASFMDSIDPRPEMRIDLSDLDRIRELYGEDGKAEVGKEF